MAVKLLLDASISKSLYRALARHVPDIDVLRLQDTPMAEAKDPVAAISASGVRRL